MPKLSLFLTLVLLLSACASTPSEQNATSTATYATAMQAVREGEANKGIEALQTIIAQSEGPMKAQAEIGLAYAYYTKGDYDLAFKQCNVFITDNPTYPQLVYVYYLRALVKTKQGEAHLKTLMAKMNPGNNYPEALREAYGYYSDLIQRYPESDYAKTAYKQIESIRKQLAKYELHLARYEMVEGNYQEAARHAEYVMEYFSDNLSRKYALTILIRAYEGMDMPQQAKNAKRQLKELTVKIEQ
jgi:outer membrane protein assembly factor BamD